MYIDVNTQQLAVTITQPPGPQYRLNQGIENMGTATIDYHGQQAITQFERPAIIDSQAQTMQHTRPSSISNTSEHTINHVSHILDPQIIQHTGPCAISNKPHHQIYHTSHQVIPYTS